MNAPLISSPTDSHTPTQVSAESRLAPASLFPAYSRGRMLRDLLIVLSLVNLCYARIWSELLTALPSDYFFLKHPFEGSDYWAAMLGVLVIGLVLWALVVVVRLYVRGSLYQVSKFAFFVVAVAVPGNAIRTVLVRSTGSVHVFGRHHELPWTTGFFQVVRVWLGNWSVRLVLAVAACLVLALVVRFLSPVVRVTAFILLCTSPFLVLTFVQALHAVASHAVAAASDRPTALPIPARSAAHLVWVVFDEWDYRLTFTERDPSLRLDALDQLRYEAVFATNAVPPAGDTPMSIPSFTDARRVKTSIPDSAEALRITYLDTGQTVTWGTQPNVFSKARAMGVNVGVLGWYLPYCRIFNSSLVSCSWFARAIQANTTGDTLGQKLRNQPRSILESMLLSPFGQSLSSQQHARDYLLMDEAARELVADKRLGLVFAHLPAPHFPFVYNRETDTFTRRNSRVRGYMDQLALVNRTLTGLRKTLVENGNWDDTTLLLTSDHWFRDSESLDGKHDPRVPFLLKMKGQHKGMSFDAPFNTVVSGELALAILSGHISTPEQAADWLLRHAEASKSSIQ